MESSRSEPVVEYRTLSPLVQALIDRPRWRPEDLGRPIPESPHAVSACLPTWRDNIGYEEQEHRVHSRLRTGYPRFVYNRFCQDLFAEASNRFCGPEEAALVFPGEANADRFCQWMSDQTGAECRVHDLGIHAARAVSFPAIHGKLARQRWQHCGEGISSRHAEACLNGSSPADASQAIQTITAQVAAAMNCSAADVYLFPNGMNAIATLCRGLRSLLPGLSTAQFGFPYIDTLKIQQKLGTGVHFYPLGSDAELEQLEELLTREAIGGLLTEFPSNPLLQSPDIERLSDLARRHGFPLIIDDTVATPVNVDLLSSADAICTSLTKFFSGSGDVTAGAIVLNRTSQFYIELATFLKSAELFGLWTSDAITLAENCVDFPARVRAINANAEQVVAALQEHPRVERVYHPSLNGRDRFARYQRTGSGYGGLFSILLKDAASTAAPFFDALRISKGPNLGTSYSLACPYTILAHYDELPFAESCGVSPYLVRVSVGLEESGDLRERFEEALSGC